MKNLILAFLLLTTPALAADQCKAFIFYQGDGQGPEPTEMECTKKATSAKACQKACATTAKKKCPKGVKEFSGTFNYVSEKTGMEADAVSGKCK